MNVLLGLLVAAPMALEQPTLADISSEAPELKKAFNGARGCVRLLLIVSPV
jgi:hypothetical protein